MKMNYETRSLYKVTNGIAEHCPPADIETDGIESVLTYALDSDDALRLADLYDAGQLQHDNVIIDNITYAVIRQR